MMCRLSFTEEAADRIRKLDKSVRSRVQKALDRLCEHPDLGKPLTGVLAGRWSYRVGDYRILYKIHRQELLVLVLTVGHRRDVYNR